MSKTYRLIDDGPGELTHRYGGTYIAKHDATGEIVPFFVRSFDNPKKDGKLNIIGVQYPKTGPKFINEELDEREVIWKIPELGYRKLTGRYGSIGVYLELGAQRVPTRGLIPNHVIATVLYYRKTTGLQQITKSLAQILVDDTGAGALTITDVYNPSFFSLDYIMKQERMGIYPISCKTAVYVEKEKEKNKILLHRGGIVGFIAKNREIKLLPRFRYFSEELHKCLT